MKSYNHELKKAILEVVENQIKENNPPITSQTLQRLLNDGYTKNEAKERIASAVVEQIYDILTYHKPFDEEKFNTTLKNIK